MGIWYRWKKINQEKTNRRKFPPTQYECRFRINSTVPAYYSHNTHNTNKWKKQPNAIWYQSQRKNGGYGEIGRRYGLNWIEPWYGNLPSENFQIQRNPGIQNGQSWAKSFFLKTNKSSESENQKRIGAETQWKLF